MDVLTSEAVVLRTWPVHEADLIVSFFTRDYGRVRGVAKAALKSRKRFGGALEPMTLARAWFVERPRQELVRLDQLEILRSPLSAPVDAVRMTVLSFFAEVLDEALPDHDPQETVFRLLVAVLEQTTVAQPWMPLALAAQLLMIIGLLTFIAVPKENPASYRALGASTDGSSNMVVVFRPETTEQDLRRTINAAGARIVDGPTVTDAYLLHVAPDNIEAALITLRADPHVALIETLAAGGKK